MTWRRVLAIGIVALGMTFVVLPFRISFPFRQEGGVALAGTVRCHGPIRSAFEHGRSEGAWFGYAPNTTNTSVIFNPATGLRPCVTRGRLRLAIGSAGLVAGALLLAFDRRRLQVTGAT